MKLVNPMSTGRFGTYIRTTPYDAAKYPMIGFEYKIPKSVKLHFLVHIGGRYYSVRLTTKSRTYTEIGRAGSIKADGKWRSAYFDLHKMLKKHLPKLKNHTVRYLCIADYRSSYNSAGATCCIDNFAIFGPGTHQPTFEWSALDPTGIKAFSYSMDAKPTSTPPLATQTAERKKALPPLARRGLYYLHVRAQDSAGNWGPSTHYPYLLATNPPRKKPEKKTPKPAPQKAPAKKPPAKAKAG